ncbi:MAG: hypothetical protein AAFZ80_12220 [Cyanobacteria bacterium P01_A01_bin.105]
MANTQQPASRGTYLLALGYGVLFLIMLWAAYTGNLPIDALNWIPNFDKFGHVILYCIASYLGHRVCQLRHLRPWQRPLFPTMFGLFTLAEEIFQGLSPNRTLDAIDLVCSFIGVVLGYWLAERHRPSAPSSDKLR